MNMEWENKPITDEYVTITTPVLLARLLERIRNAPEEIKAFHVLLSRKILYEIMMTEYIWFKYEFLNKKLTEANKIFFSHRNTSKRDELNITEKV